MVINCRYLYLDTFPVLWNLETHLDNFRNDTGRFISLRYFVTRYQEGIVIN